MRSWTKSGIALIAATLLAANAWAGEGPSGHSHSHSHTGTEAHSPRTFIRQNHLEPAVSSQISRLWINLPDGAAGQQTLRRRKRNRRARRQPDAARQV